MTNDIYESEIRPTKRIFSSPVFFGLRGERTDDKCYADRLVGWVRKNGVLCPAPTRERIAFNGKDVSVPTKPLKMFFHRYEEDGARKKMCFVYAEDGYLYRYTTNFGETTVRMVFDREPDCFDYKEVSGGNFFVIGGNERCYRYSVLTRSYYLVDSVPDNVHAILHGERMFVLDTANNDLIRYSKALDMTDWSNGVQDGGSIEIPRKKGKCIGFLSFDGQLWIVRERGFTRLTALGDNRNFTVRHIDCDCGNIKEKCFTVCGRYIVFLTDRGIFRFDGVQADEIASEWKGILDPASFGVPTAHGGKYYIGMKTVDGEDASLCVDPESGESLLLPFYASVFASSGEELFYIGEDGFFYRVKEKSGEDDVLSEWYCEGSDFGFGKKRKVLKRLSIDAEGQYEVIIEKRGKVYRKMCEGRCDLFPDLPAERFTLRIRGSYVKLKNWEAECDEY